MVALDEAQPVLSGVAWGNAGDATRVEGRNSDFENRRMGLLCNLDIDGRKDGTHVRVDPVGVRRGRRIARIRETACDWAKLHAPLDEMETLFALFGRFLLLPNLAILLPLRRLDVEGEFGEQALNVGGRGTGTDVLVISRREPVLEGNKVGLADGAAEIAWTRSVPGAKRDHEILARFTFRNGEDDAQRGVDELQEVAEFLGGNEQFGAGR